MPIWSEEGQYLAHVLGDALVKGLTIISTKRPNDPVSYLSKFLREYRKEGGGGDEEEDFNKIDYDKNIPLGILPSSQVISSVGESNSGENLLIESENGLFNDEDLEKENEEDEENNTSSQNEVSTSENEIEKDNQELSPEEEEEIDNGGANNAELGQLLEKEISAGEEQEEEGEEIVGGNETAEIEIEEKENIKEGYLSEGEDYSEIENAEKEENESEDISHSESIYGEEENPSYADEFPENSTMAQRDENGQSVLHYAASRPGATHSLQSFLLQGVNLAWRDKNFQTAREIAGSLNRIENVMTIDSWIIELAMAGELESLEQLMVDGYEPFDVYGPNKKSLKDMVRDAEQPAVLLFLNSIEDFRERLNKLLKYIRMGSLEQVKELLKDDPRLAIAISPPKGSPPLHTAVLLEQHEIVKYIATNFPESLKRSDNLKRTALHFSMGVEKVEKLTRTLVKAGARRVIKDLLGRQPSYYFINREDIGKLQKEELKLRDEEKE